MTDEEKPKPKPKPKAKPRAKAATKTKKEQIEEQIEKEAQEAPDLWEYDDYDESLVMDEESDIDSSDLHIVGDDSASDVAKAISAILGSDDFRTKTELTKQEVRALAVLIEIGDKMNAMRLLKFAENFMALMISHERGSRREVVASFGALEQFGKRDTPDPMMRFRG